MFRHCTDAVASVTFASLFLTQLQTRTFYELSWITVSNAIHIQHSDSDELSIVQLMSFVVLLNLAATILSGPFLIDQTTVIGSWTRSLLEVFEENILKHTLDFFLGVFCIFYSGKLQVYPVENVCVCFHNLSCFFKATCKTKKLRKCLRLNIRHHAAVQVCENTHSLREREKERKDNLWGLCREQERWVRKWCWYLCLHTHIPPPTHTVRCGRELLASLTYVCILLAHTHIVKHTHTLLLYTHTGEAAVVKFQLLLLVKEGIYKARPLVANPGIFLISGLQQDCFWWLRFIFVSLFSV